MAGKSNWQSTTGKRYNFVTLSRSRSLVPAGFSRLIRHSTTIDPYLDESGPSARRLGVLVLDSVSHDAIDLSTAMELRVEIRTSARAQLRVPCAVTGSCAHGVTFEVVVSAPGSSERRRSVQVAPADAGRWHVLTLSVPQGTVNLAIRARAEGTAAAPGAVCGVPSLTWTKSPRAVSRSIAFAVRRLGVSGTVRYLRTKVDADPAAEYAEWLSCHTPTSGALAAARAGAALLAARPRFALLLETPAGTDPAAVQATMASIEAQVYDAWDVHRADAADARNAAIAQSSADFVGAIRAGDRLSPLALLRAAETIAAGADVDVVYTDEDVWLPDQEQRARPYFKPDWSPELLRTCMYMGRLLLIRRTLAVAAGYRASMDGALDYDLALRVCPAARRIAHVADVLYHRAAAAVWHPDSVSAVAGEALREASETAGMSVEVAPGAMAGVWRARIAVVDRPRIAIVIPTAGQGPGGAAPPFLVSCVRSVRQRTRYPHYDLIVCDNGDLTADTLAYLETVPHKRATYRWEGDFNFARKQNFAVNQADAPFVQLMNDDLEPINGEWLDAMLEYAHQPGIGAVGPKLYYPDGRLQHVGVAVGVCGVAAHLLHQQPGGAQGCGGIAVTVRNCSAVTGACSLMRRQIFQEFGGYDETLAIDYNDVDLCLRLGRAGYRIVFTPHARLFHHESGSFGNRKQRPDEVATMRERWKSMMERDPFYNVNLTRESADCRIRPCR
jgi:GT2 family glycosyltransferase